MSRIIVKNIPKWITEEELRNKFSEKGVVTNLQMKYTKSGQFRGFAFIGYQTEEEAKQAMEYYNNTFIKTSRIKIDVCTNLGDPNKPRAWSKYASDSSANVKKQDTKKEKKKVENGKKIVKTDELIKEKMKEDSDFQEFIQVHKIKDKPLWTNDTAIVGNIDTQENDNSSEESDENEKVSESEKKKISDLEYLESKVVNKNKTKNENLEKNEDKMTSLNKFAIRIQGLPCKCKKSSIKQFFRPLIVKRIGMPRNFRAVVYVQFQKEDDVREALKKHKMFLDGNRVHITACKEKPNSVESHYKWTKVAEELTKSTETIVESGSLFVRNLSYTVVEEDLQKLFESFGPIAEIRLPIDRVTRRIKGFCFVDFVFTKDAFEAFSKLDGSIFQGRILHILPGKSKPDDQDDETKEGESFKKNKVNKQKKESANSYNWNTLFLGANAVADVISKKYNTTKQNLLSQETSESVAVRMALGETQIVIDTKNFLKSNGVNLDAFEPGLKCERSKTVILVKNLPAKTSAEELEQLFGKYGAVGRVVLPPSGITAVIEFHDPFEAKKAFKMLAYTKFYNVPLYLEWAPEAVFTKETDNAKIAETTEEKSLEAGTTLYVKNLNFDTAEEGLRNHFEKYGAILSVNIAKKPDAKNAGHFLSMGYGFVEFEQRSDAMNALKTAQHSVLDDHELQLKLSDRLKRKDLKAEKSKSARKTEQKSSKILVRNIPFEATHKEVKDLFKTFGELKFVRLPKKMSVDGGGTHRGFAFVEFVTKADAKRAFETLRHSTHLYGRRLVLEWADTEADSVDNLRQKTAQRYVESDAPAPKKLRKAAIMQQLMTASDNS